MPSVTQPPTDETIEDRPQADRRSLPPPVQLYSQKLADFHFWAHLVGGDRGPGSCRADGDERGADSIGPLRPLDPIPWYRPYLSSLGRIGGVAVKIGELAERAGVSVQTVRYYERRGLLPVPDRTASGYRKYDGADILRLTFIGRAKELGFTLSEVHELLDLQVRRGTTADDVRRRAVEKLESTRAKIRDLGSIASALERVVTSCDAHDSPETCALMHALGADADL
ncbi:MAG TPA: MerR family transcriptional regulator [Longimicrobiales bacterium]|nr:MerR family transcriptional regulator [Longimicrobiales bacterium]